MAKFYFCAIVLFTFNSSDAQIERIDTDRPDQTESAHTVPRHYFQAEIGFNKENTFHDNFDLVHPTALLKYGFKRWELRVETTVRSSYEQLIPNSKRITGVEPVEIGFKVALWEEKKWIPKTSFIGHLGFPALASKPFRPDHVAPSFRFTMQNTLAKKIALGYNVGAMWDGFTNTPLWLYTFGPGFEIGEKWYAYVEAFGFIHKSLPAQHNLDAGIAYYINDNIKVDVSSGFGISESAPKNYIALGVSFRIKMLRETLAD